MRKKSTRRRSQIVTLDSWEADRISDSPRPWPTSGDLLQTLINFFLFLSSSSCLQDLKCLWGQLRPVSTLLINMISSISLFLQFHLISLLIKPVRDIWESCWVPCFVHSWFRIEDLGVKSRISHYLFLHSILASLTSYQQLIISLFQTCFYHQSILFFIRFWGKATTILFVDLL